MYDVYIEVICFAIQSSALPYAKTKTIIIYILTDKLNHDNLIQYSTIIFFNLNCKFCCIILSLHSRGHGYVVFLTPSVQ